MAANKEELQQALVRADRAGDVEAARALAAAISNYAPPDQSGGDRGTIADSLGQGVSLGFSDELAGLLGAIPAAISTGNSPIETYRGIRDQARERGAAFAKRNPGTALAAEVGGGLLTGGLGAGRSAAVNVAKSAPKLIGTGAAVGGVGGAGYSDADTIGGVLRDAVTGAALGAAAGGVLPPIAKGIGRAVTAPARYLQAIHAARPVKKLGKAIARDDLTPALVAAKLKKLPAGAAIADAGGESVQTLARDITVQPGKARNIARALFEGRRKLAPQRIDSAVRSALNQDGEFHAAKIALEDQMKRAAGPLYETAYKQPVRITPELRKVLNRDSMKSAMVAGRALAKEEGGVIGGHIQLLDYAKRALDDKIGTALRGGNKQLAGALMGTKRALVAEMDRQVPVYAKARAAWAGPKTMEDALDTGRKFMTEDAETIASLLADMTPSEKQFFRIGAIRQIRDAVMSKSDTADAYKAIFNSPLKREKVRALFPDNKSFAKFQRAMQGEARMFETGSKVMGNSSTANKLAGVEDLAADPGVLIDAISGRPTMAALNVAKTWIRRHAPAIKNEKMRNELAEMLFSKDPLAQQRALRLIGAPVRARVGSGTDKALRIQGAVVGGQQAASQSN